MNYEFLLCGKNYLTLELNKLSDIKSIFDIRQHLQRNY